MRKFRITYNIYQECKGVIVYTYQMSGVEYALKMEDAIDNLIKKQRKNGVEIDIIKAEIV